MKNLEPLTCFMKRKIDEHNHYKRLAKKGKMGGDIVRSKFARAPK